MDILTEVRNHKRTIVEISLSDIANSEQAALLQNIKSNATRYVELFEDAIDEILPTIEETVPPTLGSDIYNVGNTPFRIIFSTNVPMHPLKRATSLRRATSPSA